MLPNPMKPIYSTVQDVYTGTSASLTAGDNHMHIRLQDIAHLDVRKCTFLASSLVLLLLLLLLKLQMLLLLLMLLLVPCSVSWAACWDSMLTVLNHVRRADTPQRRTSIMRVSKFLNCSRGTGQHQLPTSFPALSVDWSITTT